MYDVRNTFTAYLEPSKLICYNWSTCPDFRRPKHLLILTLTRRWTYPSKKKHHIRSALQRIPRRKTNMSARLFAVLVLSCLSLLAAKRAAIQKKRWRPHSRSPQNGSKRLRNSKYSTKKNTLAGKKYFQPTGRRKSTGPRDSSRLNSKKS